MSGPVDHRPWLIISQREARALIAAGLRTVQPDPDLARAIRVLRLQLRFIDGDDEGLRPTIRAALEREGEADAHV
jgi:hypothetical protein